MINEEPVLRVGLCEGRNNLRVRFNGDFCLGDRHCSGFLTLGIAGDELIATDERGRQLFLGQQIRATPDGDATFSVDDVTIGINFHWEQRRRETFRGALLLMTVENSITAINEIGLEQYLESVIASEMSSSAPLEFLKAHAITSRSWLVAMLMRKDRRVSSLTPEKQEKNEMIRWYTREDHQHFDVCADDHCQRYQGLQEKKAGRAGEAVSATRGLFLVHDDEICDARFHKACGGRTENFATAWEDKEVPYLVSISDAPSPQSPLESEDDAKDWLTRAPDAYCNTADISLLRQILPSFDQETKDFYRWQVSCLPAELAEIIKEKTGRDLGRINELVPLLRGPSGRIYRLRIQGSKASLVVGKELEIRRVLSRSHLLSSAFTVLTERDQEGFPERFILFGAGWGHGVGLCQIGAAVMAGQGSSAAAILEHYFPGSRVRKLY